MREPKDIHPLFEFTPTNHLIQFVDAPIRISNDDGLSSPEMPPPSKTVKILVCNTQHPFSFNHRTVLEHGPALSERLSKLIKIIKKVKDNAGKIDTNTPAAKPNPAIYTFTEVCDEMFRYIEDCFSSTDYHIFGQPYQVGWNASIVTVLKKSVVNSVERLAPRLCSKRVQSLLCTLADTKEQFVLHLAHLPHEGNNIHLTEKRIVNTIFSHEAFSLYPQILTGDLNIPLKEDEYGLRNIATSVVPKHIMESNPPNFNDKPTCRWDRTIGTLTLPALRLDETLPHTKLSFYEAIEKIKVASHKVIDPRTGLIYKPDSNLPSATDEYRLLSLFGKGYHTLLDSTLGEYNTALSEIFSRHEGSVHVYESYDQANISHNTVFHIPKKIWDKLTAFLDLEYMISVPSSTGTFLHHPANFSLWGDSVLKAMTLFMNKQFDPARALEETLKKGCSCQWVKEKDVFYIQFSFKKQGQLIAQHLKHRFSENGEIVDGNQFRLPISDIPKDMAGYINFLRNTTKSVEIFNSRLYGFITLTFKPTPIVGNETFLLKFYDYSFAEFALLDIDTPPSLNISKINLAQNSFNLTLDVFNNYFSEETDLNILWATLPSTFVKRVDNLINALPFKIDSLSMDENTIYSEAPFPKTLIQRFKLILKEFYYTPTPGAIIHDSYDSLFGLIDLSYEATDSFTYILGNETTDTDIIHFLYNKAKNLTTSIYNNLQNYTGKNTAYIELKNILEGHSDQHLTSKSIAIQKHCVEKIKHHKEKSSLSLLWTTPKNDKHIEFLYKSLVIANFSTNLEFNFHAKYRIQTLQQLINTQEKRELYELCVEERKRDGDKPYNKIRRNSALLLLENYLILSHPAYTANNVWEDIKRKPVEYHGTGKNYSRESDGGELTLKEILEPVKVVWNALSSLVTFTQPAPTSNDKKETLLHL